MSAANVTEGQARDGKQKGILDALRKGNTRRAAAAAVGIHHSTFYDWLKADTTFSDDVEKAEADAEQFFVSKIKAATADTWQAAAWWLERHPKTKDDWRRPIELDLRKLTAEQLLELVGICQRGVESPGDQAALAAASGPHALPG